MHIIVKGMKLLLIPTMQCNQQLTYELITHVMYLAVKSTPSIKRCEKPGVVRTRIRARACAPQVGGILYVCAYTNLIF